MNATAPAIAWTVSPGLTPYEPALAAMTERAAAIAAGTAGECVWLVEHPPLYTAGVSARAEDLLAPEALPVHRVDRGGQFTYHGPGQRVGYVMADLSRRGRDVRGFVGDLEGWLIGALAAFGVRGALRPGRVGVWVTLADGSEAKVAAIGVKLKRWVSYHGVALNVAPNLAHFAGIVPCGVREHGVTSLAALGIEAGMAEVDEALRAAFVARFGAVVAAAPPLAGAMASTDR